MSDPALDLAYLAQGCLTDGSVRSDLGADAERVGGAWAAAGLDVAVLDVAIEILARTATHLGEATIEAEQLIAALAFLEPPPLLESLVRAAAPSGLGADALAALAVHLVDVAEAAALQVFVPELPGLSRRSDRTGDDARRVGSARFLRG